MESMRIAAVVAALAVVLVCTASGAQQGCYHPESNTCGDPAECYDVTDLECVNLGTTGSRPRSFQLDCSTSPPTQWFWYEADCAGGSWKTVWPPGVTCNDQVGNIFGLQGQSFSFTCPNDPVTSETATPTPVSAPSTVPSSVPSADPTPTSTPVTTSTTVRGCYFLSSNDCSGSSTCWDSTSNTCVNIDAGGDTTARSFRVDCEQDVLYMYGASDCGGGLSQQFSTTDESKCNANPLIDDVGTTSFSFHCGGGDEPENGADCFPHDATVELESGERKWMEFVQVGDRVRVGREEFSEVYFWGHRDSLKSSDSFVTITAANAVQVTMSRGHLLYANGELTRADLVRAGDVLESESGAVVVERVERNVLRKGLYAPHTVHGDIVVDGVVASTYTDVVSPRAAHWMLAVERVGYKLGTALFGAMLEKTRPLVLEWYVSWVKA
uniref:Hedgehog protein Hint domain-containing protein n=1 Tax=Erythrolobus madagascarensis TaxID=708628 RepID=A0A7S0T498_9RHOD|mmetsp:Transcript_2141/g.4783  ORF Transcript_2141/g.4783 Transcript_2141/m.4783 type:complete len:439 (+) Transcript_2141:246-1562(+)|eukprot:CAMPEP_0185850998 /NCGR_PEP_ID=MMETSP1354-20130828/4905_1 /TAXON_ID=708628 /ORGANISM="Erythrolobus madagascarensis, Strain CCMP3276" /LENGTH=438 /DNA_ID=CAMNT_0028551737 /DNA_START=160 /DNA_END=1476 /DNA_ORIENTATION=-